MNVPGNMSSLSASSTSSLTPLPYSFQPVAKEEHPSLSQQSIQSGERALETNPEHDRRNVDSRKQQEDMIPSSSDERT